MAKGIGSGQLHADIEVGRHKLVSGLSAKLGGLDEGPDPHELLASSLVACSILTLQLYANRKSWDLGSIDVDVVIEAENTAGTQIKRIIRFGKSLPAEQLERLTEIANKCPIHKLLTGSVTIKTQVVS